MKKKVFFTALMMAFAAGAQAQEKLVTYTNARFEYSIAYPSNLFIPQGEAINGDGQTFLSRTKDAEIHVWGSWKLDETAHMCHALYGIENPDSPNIVYKISRKNMSVVSGYKGSRIFYRKYLVIKDRCLGFEIEYDTASREKYDALVGEIAKSFRTVARH